MRRPQSLKDRRFDEETKRKRLQKPIAERLTIRAQKASFQLTLHDDFLTVIKLAIVVSMAEF